MYAYDTTLYCNINQNIGEDVSNAELLKLWEWLGANKLSLYIAKLKLSTMKYEFLRFSACHKAQICRVFLTVLSI